VLKLLEQIVRQADGPVGVVSDCAVDDLDFEHVVSIGWSRKKQRRQRPPEKMICATGARRFGKNVRKL
jgi:hypothetical protein